MKEGYLGCLGIARALIGLAQSALMLGGCAGLFLMPTPDLFGTCLVWFLILCGAQLAIVLLAAMAGPTQ